jgi:hypothetical protein
MLAKYTDASDAMSQENIACILYASFFRPVVNEIMSFSQPRYVQKISVPPIKRQNSPCLQKLQTGFPIRRVCVLFLFIILVRGGFLFHV